MKNGPLLVKSKAFALEIIRICDDIRKEKRNYVLTDQLMGSGTSIGANIREASYAASTADFLNKLQIALKECNETEYWLELFIESGYYSDKAILDKCIELKKMLISATKTIKESN